MRKIVLDTNALIMAISARNVYHKVWQAFLNGEYILCVTNEIIEEYLEVLSHNINSRTAEAIIYTILTRHNVEMLDTHYHFHLIQVDEDDNKFVDCAIAANATYIVTEDHHFDVLKQVKFPSVSVIGLDEFIKYLSMLS